MADGEKKKTLKFIEDYRSLPQLWDPNNKLYTNKEKRNDGLAVLSSKYHMDIDGIKKKIKSLRSYFSKEHRKVNKKKSGAGSDEIYVSQWFAYKHLLFTADSVTPRETRESTTEDENDQDAQAEIYRESSATSQSTCMSEDEQKFTRPPIRKKRIIKRKKIYDKEEKAYKFVNKANEEFTQKDEFTIYGQLIAHKIRNLNTLNRLLAQQRINNILFDLEMQQMTGAATTQTFILRDDEKE